MSGLFIDSAVMHSKSLAGMADCAQVLPRLRKYLGMSAAL